MTRIQSSLAGFGLLVAAACIVAWPGSRAVPRSGSPASERNTDGARGEVEAYDATVDHAPSVSRSAEVSPSRRESSRPVATAHQLQSTSGRLSPATAGGPRVTRHGSRNRKPSHTREPLAREASQEAVGPVRAEKPDASFTWKSSAVASAPGSAPQAELPPAVSPAVLIEIDHPAVSSPEARERLAEVAGDFVDAVTGPALESTTPEYRVLWDREQAIADARFRSLYGGHAWTAHHIQSHHAKLTQEGP